MAILVMKFGGTSVGSANAVRQVIEIVQKETQKWDNVVVVTSAIGGITNSLVKLVEHAAKHDFNGPYGVKHQLDALRARHQQAALEFMNPEEHADELAKVDAHIDVLLEELHGTCEEIAAAGGADSRLSDTAMSMGERIMAGILAAIMRVNGVPAQPVDASKVIVTDRRFQNAQPDFAPSRANAQKIIGPLLEQKQVAIVTGYIGATPEGQITTLGRGGSDYSATYLGSLIDANDVWIWTDVNGVMSADPRKIKEAQVIDMISYQEVSEFAHFGAKVLHPRCVEPLMGPHIPLRVCNTFNPDHPGTRINSASIGKPKHLSAVTSIDGILVFAPSNAVPSVPGLPSMTDLASQVLEKVLLQAAPPVITVNAHAGHLLCFVIPTTARRTANQESFAALQETFAEAYPSAEWRVEPIAIVAAIGVVDVQQTMQVLTAVKSVRANLLALGHGSPACCLLALPPEQSPRVVKRLHSLAVSVQSNLPYAENDPAAPAAIPAIPNNRRRKNTRQNKRGNPPHRVIPL